MPSFGCNGARHFPQRVMLLNALSTIRANIGYFSQHCLPFPCTFKPKPYRTLTHPHHSDQIGPRNATDVGAWGAWGGLSRENWIRY